MTDKDDFPNLSHWNHRVIRRTYKVGNFSEDRYAIHEVYYDEENCKPTFWTESPVPAEGTSLEELKKDLEWHLAALEKPVLIYEELNPDATE